MNSGDPVPKSAQTASKGSFLAPGGRAALAFIFVTVLIDMLGFGLIAPVLPTLVQELYGGSTVDAAYIIGVFGTAWALMQFVFSPLLGVLSDRYGRRPVILLSCLGMGLDYVLMALSPTVGWLFVGRVISGITSANGPTASAYISDVTPAEKRASGFGVISAAFGIGFIVGPALGGLLAQWGLRAPFWAAAALSLLNALYGLLVLPESLPAEKRRATVSPRHLNPLSSLRLLRRHADLESLAGIDFLGGLAHQAFSIWVLYTQYRFAWTPRENGLSLTAVGLGSIVVSLLLVKPIVRRLGDGRTLVLGLLSGVAGMLTYALAPSGVVFAMGIPVMMLFGVYPPSAQSLMTRHVSHEEQGELQGALGSIRSGATIVGPLLFGWTFAFSLREGSQGALHGAPFFLGALLLLAAAVVAWRAFRSARVESPADVILE